MKILNFIGNNWYMIVLLTVIIACIVLYIRSFITLPTDKKLNKIREWLKIAVDKAEKAVGSGNGEVKLKMVYDWFTKKFPITSVFISYDLFKDLVDEALEKISNVLE